MPIARKLAAIMGEVQRVAKNGRNDFHKYDYVTEADLVEEIRGHMAARGVAFFPTVKSLTQEGDITRVEMEFSFIDGEDDSRLTTTFWGVGQDKGDKGAYKAYTGAVKYALMKTFLVPTGDADDPEYDGKTPPVRPQDNRKPAPQKQPQKPQTQPKAFCVPEDYTALVETAEANGWAIQNVNAWMRRQGYTSIRQVPASVLGQAMDYFSRPAEEATADADGADPADGAEA